MTKTFSPIPTGAIPAARALRSVSQLGFGGRLEALLNEVAPAAIAAVAAGPVQLPSLPLPDHFFAGQLEPVQSALSCWLKEQLR